MKKPAIARWGFGEGEPKHLARASDAINSVSQPWADWFRFGTLVPHDKHQLTAYSSPLAANESNLNSLSRAALTVSAKYHNVC